MACCESPDIQTHVGLRPYIEGGLYDVPVLTRTRTCLSCGDEQLDWFGTEALYEHLCAKLTEANSLLPHHFQFVRKALGYNTACMARMLGVSETHMRGVEIGSDPVPSSWHQLLKALVQSGQRTNDTRTNDTQSELQ